jgi:hypothetical protein
MSGIKIDNFLVSSFYTENTVYQNEIANVLIPSLEKINLKYNIEVLENKGSWLRNVAQKPLSILRTMEKFPSYNIIALDADSEVVQFPKLFNEIPLEYDIAYFTLDWDSWYKNNTHKKEAISSTIFFRNNEKVRNFVKEWYVKAEISMEWEQKIMDDMIKERENIKVFPLPIEYCAITSLPGNKEPHIKIENPVILQHQASRKLKKLIH